MRERKNKEIRELEGVNRALEKKVRELTREISRLEKMVQKLLLGEVEKESKITKKKINTCPACKDGKIKDIILDTIGGSKIIKVCDSCKYRGR